MDSVVNLTGIKHLKDTNGGNPNGITLSPQVCQI